MVWRYIEAPLVPTNVSRGGADRRVKRCAAAQSRLLGLEAWAATEGFERWTTKQLRELLSRRGVQLEHATRIERSVLVEMVRDSAGGRAKTQPADGPQHKPRMGRVRLGSIECSGLDNMFCMAVVVLVKDQSGKWSELGSTEFVQDCLTPRFRTSFDVSNCFERMQSLQFEVMNVDLESSGFAKHDVIGRSAELRLQDIVARNGHLSADLTRPGKTGSAGSLNATVKLLHGSWNGVMRSSVLGASEAACETAKKGTQQEQIWNNASEDWRRKRDRDAWWSYYALMPRVWSSWSTPSDGWDAAAATSMLESQVATFRQLHSDVLDMSLADLRAIGVDIFQLWKYHTTMTMDKPRTQDDVVKLLAKWVGRERILWSRVWNKYAMMYPDAFPLPSDGCAVSPVPMTGDNQLDRADAVSICPHEERQQVGLAREQTVAPEAAKLRIAMVEQLLADHRRLMAAVPAEGQVDHVEQLVLELGFVGDDLMRTVLSDHFYRHYDQLHAVTHNLQATSPSCTAWMGPMVIFLHKNDGAPLVLGSGKRLRLDPSDLRPKPFDGIGTGTKMDTVLDLCTQALQLQLYARRLFRPDGKFRHTLAGQPCRCSSVS